MSNFALRFLPAAAWCLTRLLGATWRIQVENPNRAPTLDQNRNEGIIFIFWHNRILIQTYYYHHCAITAMISKSRDGELIARTARLFGHDAVRGSTSRNSTMALSGAMELLRKGQNIAVTPDGPQGPRYSLQAGVIEMAKRTGSPIVPMSYIASLKYCFKSWDGFILPLPFSRIRIRFGSAIRIPEQLNPDEFEAQRKRVEEALRQLGGD